MTSKGQITKIASRDGIDARVVERDYVLVHAVALISAHDTDRTLIFKGGTSLRLLHFEEYRYSADLDYSVVAGSEEQARELIRGALAQKPPDTIKQLELTEEGQVPHFDEVERNVRRALRKAGLI
jgi:predicted nucleotidyltransferase component of viral defense system